MSVYVKGQVVEILSTTELLLKLEPVELARKGMELVVYEEGDPITTTMGVNLGAFELQKALIRVTHVQEGGIAYAESSETRRVYVGPDEFPPVDPSDFMDYDPDEMNWEDRPLEIAMAPEKETDKGAARIVQRPKSLKEMLKTRLKNAKVVVGDKVRSTFPIG